MKINSYLLFNGDCEAAFKFYEKCLGAKIQMMMSHADSPMPDQVPANWKNKVLHASLLVGEQQLMGSDAPPDHYRKPQGFSVSINLKDVAEAERIFRELSEGGSVQMPLGETFWAVRFGMFVDRFGIPWMVNCEKPAQ